MTPKRCLRSLFLIGGIALLAPTLSDCALLREAIGIELRRPKLSLADVTIEKASLTALELGMSIRVDNPNDFSLDFDKLDYKVSIDGSELAKGTHSGKVTLPAESHVLVKLPLIMHTSQAFALLSKVFTTSEETFAEVVATANFLTPIGALGVQFQDKKPLRKLTGF
jgi:LEA14-like dessication related protein